jgi:multiple sugar transport system substrate-binding protein
MNKKSLSIMMILVMAISGYSMVSTTKAVELNQGTQIVFFTGAQTTDTLTNMIDDFNALSDYDFTVDLQTSTWETQSQYDTYSSRFASEDDSFDVISMDVIWPPGFIQNGWLENLDSVFPTSEQDKFLEAPILAGSYDGSIYGVPWFHDSGLLYYRTDVLTRAADLGLIPEDRAPKTWDELHDWSIAITENGTITDEFGAMDGFVWQGKAYEGLMCDFMEILGGTGQTSWLDQDSSGDYVANFETQNVKDALAFMNSLLEDGASPEAVLTYAEEESRAVWNSGDAVFHRNWPYAYALSLQTSGILNGTETPDGGEGDGVQNFAVAPMPSQVADDPDARTGCLGGWQLGVNAYSNHKTEAKEFVLWLTEEDQQLAYFAGNGNLPTRKSAYDETKLAAAGAASQDYIVAYLPAFEKALPRPVHPAYNEMSAELWEPINSAVAGDITPDTAATQMQDAVNKILTETVTNAPFNAFWAFFSIIALGALVSRRRKY